MALESLPVLGLGYRYGGKIGHLRAEMERSSDFDCFGSLEPAISTIPGFASARHRRPSLL